MKSRMTLIFSSLVILLGTMTWVVLDRRGGAVEPVPTVAVAPMPAITTAEPTPMTTAGPATTDQTLEASAPDIKTPPTVHVEADGEMKYTARDGDTVSQLAVALLGRDSKDHRDAVIAANPSLQANPDRVLTGYSYSVSPETAGDKAKTDAAPAAVVDHALAAPVEPAREKPSTAAVGPKVRYTAQSGDTVGGLAAGLLGADTSVNRDAITAGNASLRANPDHLVAGKSYTITAPNGLAANSDPTPASKSTTQPDADDAAKLGVGRTVRYTAQPGDTVSSIAVALLGSDTPANREMITRSNPSLKEDVDHLVAGQTYWIATPQKQ